MAQNWLTSIVNDPDTYTHEMHLTIISIKRNWTTTLTGIGWCSWLCKLRDDLLLDPELTVGIN